MMGADQDPHGIPARLTSVGKWTSVKATKESTRPTNGAPGFFPATGSADRGAGLHHQLGDGGQADRGEMGDGVDHRLVLVPGVIPGVIPVAEERPEGLVLARQFAETVIVAVETLLDHPHDQDAPQIHAGTALAAVGAGEDVRLEDGKEAGPESVVGPRVITGGPADRAAGPGCRHETWG